MEEITDISAEINELARRNTIEKINDTKSRFFKKINKVGKHLARMRGGEK